MSRRFFPKLLVVLMLFVLFAWSPWLTQESAQVHAVDSFNRTWEGVADGCGLNCKGCGAISSKSVPFGILITIEYACGMVPADSPEYHRQVRVFVSPLGTVHGLPKP